MKKRSHAKVVWLAALAAAVAVLAVLLWYDRPNDVPREAGQGQIYLYGERHADSDLLAQELELWGTYYSEAGMRDLFVEMPCYTAAFLNLWMQAEDDKILEMVYADWAGTPSNTQAVLDFYKQIKDGFPETIFHGFDVGHQYNTLGESYLGWLKATRQGTDTEEYRQTQEVIEQGRIFYQSRDREYRESSMTENFIRQFDSLNGADAMVICGAAHADPGAVGTMANLLKTRYGEALYTEDMTLMQIPLRTEEVEIAGKTYTADYFGEEDLSAFTDLYLKRAFWRLRNAYEDFKDCPVTGEVLPYNNYPVKVEDTDVFLIEYTKVDSTVVQEYYRGGIVWQGLPSTEAFCVE